MQSNIFVQIRHLLKESEYSELADKVIEFLKRYKKGEWVYPGAMYRYLNIGIKEVYDILSLAQKLGYVEEYLEIYCPDCKRYANKFYRSVMDVPEICGCPHCDYEIEEPLKHAVVIYKVIK